MHSPKIIGILCATCLGSRKECTQDSHKLPRKTPARLPYHTNEPINSLQYKKYDMHGIYSKLSKLCMTWQFARNKLSQARQTILELLF